MLRYFLQLLIITLLFPACGQAPAKAGARPGHQRTINAMTNASLTPGHHDLNIAGHEVTILVPENLSLGWIMVLPGWNFSRMDWCEKTSLCKTALAMGFGLVLPEMGKSIYAEQYYPESRKDWAVFPSRVWLRDTCFSFLQDNYAMLLPGQRNFLLGLSTGARGVALLLEDTGTLFRAGAMLSGDFDQRTMTDDNLMNGIYGSFQEFPDRWAGNDNPQLRIADLKVPVYISHGMKDNIVPFNQSEAFVNGILSLKPDLSVHWHPVPDAGHDYVFWGSHTLPVLRFFQSVH